MQKRLGQPSVGASCNFFHRRCQRTALLCGFLLACSCLPSEGCHDSGMGEGVQQGRHAAEKNDEASGPGAGGSPAARVAVDQSKGEVTVPCLFVNPTQLLEVFACHWNGPTHETVLAFNVEGKAIYDALVGVGMRPPSFWNATGRVGRGKPDVRYTLGDRVVILLRWQRDGNVVELPAEEILREADTHFPPFIRGFTFGATKIPIGDPPKEQIARQVEITIGGLTRGERAVDSILFSPHDLSELIHWLSPLEISPEALPDLPKLVDEQIPCSMILQKVSGETELLSIAQRYESDPRRKRFLESLVKTAAAIDQLKERYAAGVEDVERMLEEGEAEGNSSEAERQAQNILVRLNELELTVLRIWKLYLELFEAQEGFKVNTLAEEKDLDPKALELARVRYERLCYEPRLVELELRKREIELQGTPPSEKDRLLAEAYGLELEALNLESNTGLLRLQLTECRERLLSEESEYVKKILREDIEEADARGLFLEKSAEVKRSQAEENRARANGTWDKRRDQILQRRQRALHGKTLAERKLQWVDVKRQIRWSEDLLWDDRLRPEEKAEEASKLKELKERFSTLQKEIETAASEVPPKTE